MDLALSFIVIIGAVCIAVWVIYVVLFLAPWFPTRARNLDVIDDMIRWRDDTVFYDLGSGDARVCLWLAKRHPRVQFVGIEISFIFHLIGSWRLSLSGRGNIQLVRGDALRHDVSDAHYGYVFGTHRTIDGIVCDTIAPQVSAGTQVI